MNNEIQKKMKAKWTHIHTSERHDIFSVHNEKRGMTILTLMDLIGGKRNKGKTTRNLRCELM